LSNQNDNLENTRLCLLKLWHGYNQTHAGYLIAIIIGTLTLISRWDIVFVVYNLPIVRYAFYFILIAISCVVSYVIKRMFYWITLSSFLAKIEKKDIIAEYQGAPYAFSLEKTARQQYKESIKKLALNERIGGWRTDLFVFCIAIIGFLLWLALIFVDCFIYSI
jgi:hypothetical protein